MTGYAKKSNENATMSFKVNNKQLLKTLQQNMGKNWKVIKDRLCKQTCLQWWW